MTGDNQGRLSGMGFSSHPGSSEMSRQTATIAGSEARSSRPSVRSSVEGASVHESEGLASRMDGGNSRSRLPLSIDEQARRVWDTSPVCGTRGLATDTDFEMGEVDEDELLEGMTVEEVREMIAMREAADEKKRSNESFTSLSIFVEGVELAEREEREWHRRRASDERRAIEEEEAREAQREEEQRERAREGARAKAAAERAATKAMLEEYKRMKATKDANRQEGLTALAKAELKRMGEQSGRERSKKQTRDSDCGSEVDSALTVDYARRRAEGSERYAPGAQRAPVGLRDDGAGPAVSSRGTVLSSGARGQRVVGLRNRQESDEEDEDVGVNPKRKVVKASAVPSLTSSFSYSSSLQLSTHGNSTQ